MANKPPAYPMYAADFNQDTAAFTLAEKGAYITLLNHSWINRGIPDDLTRIAKIVGESVEYFEQELWPTLSAKWVSNGTEGILVNPRQEKERRKQQEYRDRQRDAGLRGVEAKKAKGAYPFDQKDTTTDQATLAGENKQPLDEETSKPCQENQGSVVRKSSSSFSSSSLNTTTRKEDDPAQRGPLGKLLDSDQEFKKAFDEARKYFPDIGAWFGKSFKKYGDIAIAQNRNELLATMQAIAKKKQFDGDAWGYALKTFLGKVRDKDLAEQGIEKHRRTRHIRDLYKGFKSHIGGDRGG